MELVQLLVQLSEHISITRDASGKSRTPETYFHRIIVMGVMSDWRVFLPLFIEATE